MITVSFSNQKGGCAKTTSVWALGTGLHRNGYKVLLVDLDAQSNLSFTANVDLLNLKTSLYDVFKGNARVIDAIQTVEPNLDIITGGLQLTSADMDFNQQGREYMLAQALEEISGNYDYCIIDTEPHLGVLTTNALVASNKVVIPLQADIYGLQGMEQLKGFINRIRTGYRPPNPNLEISGLLITRVDERTRLTKALLKPIYATAEEMQTKVYNAKIHATTAIGETALLQDNIFNVAPDATATKDYTAFINEFLNE